MLYGHGFIIYSIETEDFYKDISNDIESRFDFSGYPNNGSRPLPVGKNKKVTGLMKDELGGEIMKEFISLRPKMYIIELDRQSLRNVKGLKSV